MVQASKPFSLPADGPDLFFELSSVTAAIKNPLREGRRGPPGDSFVVHHRESDRRPHARSPVLRKGSPGKDFPE